LGVIGLQAVCRVQWHAAQVLNLPWRIARCQACCWEPVAWVCMAPRSAWLHAALPQHARGLPQVDAISSRAQPLVLSARKRARRVSDFVHRRSSLCVPPLGKLHER